MNSTNNHEPNAFENKRRQRFFVGESDSEFEDEDEQQHQRRSSISESECSDDSNVVIGFAPTAFLDDDSGLGMGSSLETEEEEKPNDSSRTSTNQILPLRSVNIGNKSGSSNGHNTNRKRRRYFNDFYQLTDEFLGSGAYASVQTCIELASGKEFAVKLVDRHEPGHTRSRIHREVEIFKMCRGHPNFVQLVEDFADQDYFYLVFEKMRGGPLLKHIQQKVCFTEQEASLVTKDIANALKFLHERGVAHRDLKPENVLCTSDGDGLLPVKLCDLDLASKPNRRRNSRPLPNVQSQPDLASPVGSAEFLAPEVVDAFHHDGIQYDRRCDLWSLGVLVYILLCGYPPFIGECDRENCGWAQGKPCNDCQDNLFHRIQRGEFDFPDEEWENISNDAKELISHLLVKNVRERYSAVDVLNHPWIRITPIHANNLVRKESARDVQNLNQYFNAMNRFAVTRLSSRFEETIPSLNLTPKDEQLLTDALIASNLRDEVVVNELEMRQNNDRFPKFDESVATYSNQSSTDAPYDEVEEPPPLTENPQEALEQMQTYDADAAYSTTIPPQHQGLSYDLSGGYSPMIGINMGMIYAPPMVVTQSPPMMFAPPLHLSYTLNGIPTSHYSQHSFGPNEFFYQPPYYSTGSIPSVPLMFAQPHGHQNAKQAELDQKRRLKDQPEVKKFNQKHRLEQLSATPVRLNDRKQGSNRFPPNLSYCQLNSTPDYNAGAQSLLRPAISGLGLQSCQGSSAKELRVYHAPSREAQVNV